MQHGKMDAKKAQFLHIYNDIVNELKDLLQELDIKVKSIKEKDLNVRVKPIRLVVRFTTRKPLPLRVVAKRAFSTVSVVKRGAIFLSF